MDNQEPLINWEQEAIFYQDVLEAALEYQRQLEGKRETLDQTIERQERFSQYQSEEIWNMQDSLQEMVRARYARELEETIEHLKAKLAGQNTITDRWRTHYFSEERERKLLESENVSLRAEVRTVKKSYQEQAKKQRETIREQAEQIQQFKQALHLHQRLLREQRETWSSCSLSAEHHICPLSRSGSQRLRLASRTAGASRNRKRAWLKGCVLIRLPVWGR